MDSSHYGNAMTEIALALAMAFFSLMVLTLVSMGAGEAAETAKGRVKEAVLAQFAPPRDGAPETAVRKVTAEDTLILFQGGRFYGRDLKPVTVGGGAFEGRVILAVDPAASLADAMRARSRINAADLLVSPLDEKWRNALDRAMNAR